MNAQLETKFYKLEKVIRDADARIADLDRLVRQADGRPVCDVTVGDAVNESSGETPPYPVPGGDRRYAQVYEFADAGLSPGEIAEQTGHTAGEVELILALRRHAAPSAGG
jgi:hypothetical protein